MKKFKISETFLASLICVVMLIMSLALLPISPILSAIHFAITLAISVLEALILKYRKYHTLDISKFLKLIELKFKLSEKINPYQFLLKY